MAEKTDETEGKPEPFGITHPKNLTLAECNAQANGLRLGAKKRHESIVKRVKEFVQQELKRA